MSGYKYSHQRKNRGKTYETVDKVLDEGLGTTTWRENRDLEALALEKANAYVFWVKENGRLPREIKKENRKSETDKEEENRLAQWMSDYKQKHKKNFRGKTYASVDKVLDKGLATTSWRNVQGKQKDTTGKTSTQNKVQKKTKTTKSTTKKRKQEEAGEKEESIQKKAKEMSMEELQDYYLEHQHQQQKIAVSKGIYTSPNIDAKVVINNILSDVVPPKNKKGKIIVLDHDDFLTSSALVQRANIDIKRLIIPQRDLGSYNVMKKNSTYGKQVVHCDLVKLDISCKDISMVYADLMGSIKEAIPIMDKFQGTLSSGSIFAITISHRNGEQVSYTNEFTTKSIY
jgi:hypothetical protein